MKRLRRSPSSSLSLSLPPSSSAASSYHRLTHERLVTCKRMDPHDAPTVIPGSSTPADHLPAVLLVREPRRCPSPSPASSSSCDTLTTTVDPYEAALSPFYSTYFLPALTHDFVNIDVLSQTIRRGPAGRFGGVIITSQRAVGAWAKAAGRVSDGASLPQDIATAWTETVPFYCVGPATARSLLSLGSHTSLVPYPSMVRGADETGNAERLSDYIITDIQKRTELKVGQNCTTHKESEDGSSPLSSLPLLYLVGDKTGVVLTTKLAAAAVPFEMLHVYDTFPSPTFEEDFKRVVSSVLASAKKHHEQEPLRWIVFFSPSGAEQAIDLLKDPHHKELGAVRTAVIGPTTRDFLIRSGWDCHAMAESPNPESLLRAIQAYDSAR